MKAVWGMVALVAAVLVATVAAPTTAQPTPPVSAPAPSTAAGQGGASTPAGQLRIPGLRTPPAPAPGAIQAHAAGLVWKEATHLPAGTQVAVLEGDPTGPGIFTIRLKVPPLFHLTPHTHPAAERVTILEGDLAVGFGVTDDPRGAKRFGPGDFYVNPPGVPHSVWSRSGGIVQLTGEGPWMVVPHTDADTEATPTTSTPVRPVKPPPPTPPPMPVVG